MIVVLLLACGGDGDGCTDDDCGIDTAETAPPPGPCSESPCVVDLAPPPWLPPRNTTQAGIDLALHGDTLFVGAPGFQGDGAWTPRAVVVEVPSMQTVASLKGRTSYDGTGYSVAATDLDSDGVPEVAVGAFNAIPDPDHQGSVFLLNAPTATVDLEDAFLLRFSSPHRVFAGLSVGFSDVVEGGGAELLVSGSGQFPDDPGGVYVVDPSLRGEFFEEDATVTLVGEASGLGQSVVGWDADGDGAKDLVTSLSDSAGVGWFAGPLAPGVLAEADAAGSWIAPEDHCRCFGDTIEAVGDLTGDGLPDLAFSAPTWDADGPTRTGRAYVATAGALQHGAADALGIQVRGTELGEGLGIGLASGDIDGDGQDDLLVGATGVYPGTTWPGKLLVYRGPLDGVLLPGDADAVVHGENVDDLFGRAIVTLDADGDAHADVIVSASGHDEGTGAVYLLSGVDLLP